MMNEKLIKGAVEDYLESHHFELNECLELNVWYPIKNFQVGKYQKEQIICGSCDVTVIPYVNVSSIVVAPKEEPA